MTFRQYFVTALLGLLATALFPRVSVEELMLRSGGQIAISPSAGNEAWPGFIRIENDSYVGHVTRFGNQVAFKLGIGNSLYTVRARCEPLMSVTSDPEGKADHSRVVNAAEWVCLQH